MTLLSYKNVVESQGRITGEKTEYETKLKLLEMLALLTCSQKMNPLLLAKNNVTFYALFSLI